MGVSVSTVPSMIDIPFKQILLDCGIAGTITATISPPRVSIMASISFPILPRSVVSIFLEKQVTPVDFRAFVALHTSLYASSGFKCLLLLLTKTASRHLASSESSRASASKNKPVLACDLAISAPALAAPVKSSVTAPIIIYSPCFSYFAS